MALFSLTAKMRQLLARRDGIAALEFALAFPLVLTMVMGIIEVSMILFVNSLLEGGLRDASRFAITGAAGPGAVTRQDQIVAIINDRSMGLFTVTASDVHMRVYDTFDQVGQPEPITNDVNHNGKCDTGDTYSDVNGNSKWDADMAKSGAGGSSSVVVYDVTLNWSLITGFMTSLIGQDGHIPVWASIAVRNEPYSPTPAGTVVAAPTQRTC